MSTSEIRLTGRCDRLRQNNGIIEVLFVHRSMDGGMDQQVLANLHLPAGSFEHGAFYDITICPARNLKPSGEFFI